MKIKRLSLKTRLIVILLMSTLIPLLLLGAISYVALQNVFSQKIKSGIQSTLLQTRVSLENILGNMEYASLQLSYEGKDSIVQALSVLMTSQDIFEQMKLTSEISHN